MIPKSDSACLDRASQHVVGSFIAPLIVLVVVVLVLDVFRAASLHGPFRPDTILAGIAHGPNGRETLRSVVRRDNWVFQDVLVRWR
jgi:hypothetical protein